MKYVNFILTVATFGLVITACGKSEQNTGDVRTGSGDVNTAAQTGKARSGQLVVNSRDENGWYHDFNQGMTAAISENKPALIDFYTDWCHWCEVMDEKTFSDPEIKKLFLADWITIKANAEDDKTTGTYKGKTMTYREFARTFGVTGFPSYAFIDSKGELVTVIPGYYPKEKFSRILDYMKKELYTRGVDMQKYMESGS